ncbi:hypothetical protein [Streptomyces sp. MNU76]|nr:hypothetical protein [Streptomyces sp. MNU76]
MAWPVRVGEWLPPGGRYEYEGAVSVAQQGPQDLAERWNTTRS